MPSRDPTTWMWEQACGLLEQAERMHRQFFRLSASTQAPLAWEPPADVLESDDEFIVIVALPGVPADRIQVGVEDRTLVVQAERTLPYARRGGAVRRLEIPYGRFERSIPLPAERLEAVSREVSDGCLVLRLRKLG